MKWIAKGECFRHSKELVRRRIMGMPRILAAVIFAVSLLAFLFIAMCTMSLVTVTDTQSGFSQTLLTAKAQPMAVLQMAGIATTEHDEILQEEGPNNTESLTINRAFPVYVEVDGERMTDYFVQGTVQDLLTSCGVTLGEDDYVQPSLDTPLSAEMSAEIFRVEYRRDVRFEILEPEMVEDYVDTLGEDHGFVNSFNGEYEIVCIDEYTNGELSKSELVEISPVLVPRAQDSYTIEQGVPASRITGFEGVHLGEDGIPLEYTDVWHGAVSTAYSSSGGMGASGLGLYCGTVAVNPNVIPYGSRMFITSADGSFVYGFAIATDTGTAMMEGHVGLDLYFETNDECYWFGKRELSVYFLD